MSEQLAVVTKHTVKSLLARDDYRARLNDLLGARAPQFVASLVQISQDYKIEKCEPGSVIAAGMIAASLDLPINPQLGFAYVIPYGTKASFQMGYRGYVQLAMRSGLYKRLNVTPVFEGELLKYDRVKADVLIDESKRKTDKVIGYLAYFELTNGAEHALFWTVDQVVRHAERFSQAYRQKKQDSPWFTDFDAMGCKTVLKALIFHWGPLSVQMQTAVVEDTSDDESATLRLPEAAPEPKVRRKKSPETLPEPAPASPEPAKVQTDAGSGLVENPKADAINALTVANITYDDFSDFIQNQGIYRDIKNFPSYEDVPGFVWDTLAKMPQTLVRIIKTYGTKQS